MRIAASEQFSCSPAEVRTWSFADLLEAHFTLDAYQDIKTVHAWASRPDRK